MYHQSKISNSNNSLCKSQEIEIDEAEASHLLDTLSASAIAKLDHSTQHHENDGQQQTLPEMLYDEDISETSMIGLQNNGRGKAGVNRTETESVARKTENDVQVRDTENDEQAADIEGFNDTVLYTSRGYDSVSSDKVFIQPCHSGSIHWTLLTNINVQQEERGRKVCLYDSLVNFKYQSKVDCDVPPAIEWQAAQLSPKENCRNGKVLEILVTPCEQQQNGSDCGVFTMVNGLALANGYLPEELLYTSQNKRQELLSMFRQGHLSMPDFTLRNSNRNFEYRFMRPVLARIQEMVLLPKIIHQVLLVCDCRMPENYDNVVCYDKCENIFHQRCYMMGASLWGNTIAAQLQCFLCYQCRKSGEYTFS